MTVYHTWKAGDADDAPAYCGVVKPDMTPDGGAPEFCGKCMEVLHAQIWEDADVPEFAKSQSFTGRPKPVVDITDPDDPEVPPEVKNIARALLEQLLADKPRGD